MTTKAQYEELIGMRIQHVRLDGWDQCWPIVNPATMRIIGIAEAGDDLSGYELRDIVHGRLVARECASDVLVSRP